MRTDEYLCERSAVGTTILMPSRKTNLEAEKKLMMNDVSAQIKSCWINTERLVQHTAYDAHGM